MPSHQGAWDRLCLPVVGSSPAGGSGQVHLVMKGAIQCLKSMAIGVIYNRRNRGKMLCEMSLSHFTKALALDWVGIAV